MVQKIVLNYKVVISLYSSVRKTFFTRLALSLSLNIILVGTISRGTQFVIPFP